MDGDNSLDDEEVQDLEMYEMNERINRECASSSVNINTDETSPLMPQKHEQKLYTTKHYRKASEIYDYFDSFDNSEDDLENCGIIALKIINDEELLEIHEDDWNTMSKKHANKAIIIIICDEKSVKTSIYWKSKEIQYFKMLMLPKQIINKEVIEDYVVEFLIKSLKNDELGFINRLSQQAVITEIDINFLIDSRGYNLLLLAAEEGNAEVVQVLLSLGMSTNIPRINIDAQSLAWNGRHFDVLLVLAQANLTYPAGIDTSEVTGGFKDFCDDTVELHRSIISNDQENVQKILNKYDLTHFYNFNNESALKIAIQNDALEVYEILLSRKYKFGSHENPEEYLEELSKQSKRYVERIHNKYSIVLYEKHINVLIENSFICHDETDAEKKTDYVQKAYRTLNSHILIKIILMVVAASKKFKIIFDFSREAVNVLDPTTTPETQGIFYLSGRIYIGAKQLLDTASENIALATIAHEFCHFAMNVVYENKARPYKDVDTITEQEFEEISQICEANKDKESVVGSVFNDYPEHMHHGELIVRVVHLIALYRNDPAKLSEVQDIYLSLFNFYEHKTVPDMRTAVKEIEAREEQEKLAKDKKITKLKYFSIILGILSVIGIVVVGFIVRSIFYKPDYVFNEMPIADQLKVKNATIDYKNLEVRFCDLFPENSTAYDKLTSDHIAQMLRSETLNFSDPYLHYLDELVVHSWENITEKLKDKILISNFTFQNESLRFGVINSEIIESLNSQQMIQILDNKNLIIGNMIVNKTKFYAERKMYDEDIYEILFALMFNITDGFKDRNKIVNISNIDLEFSNFFHDFHSLPIADYHAKVRAVRAETTFKLYSYLDFKYGVFEKIAINDTYRYDFNEIFRKAEISKIFILSSEAGMGKTVTFEQFTMRIKKKFPMFWVSYVDLKDHTKLYRNENLENVEALLEKIMSINSENDFERKIFQDFYQSGKVVLLWNGFDEISPTYSEFVVSLLSHVRNTTNNVQFICTRPLYSSLLQRKFNVLAYKLVPLDKLEQQEFLRKCFISRNIEDKNIPKYIEKVQKITQALESKKDTRINPQKFDTPLMLEMMADLISYNVEIYDSENLYHVYQKFVEEKINIWQVQSEIGRNLSRKIISSSHKFNMIEVYQKYALKNEVNEFGMNIYSVTRIPSLKIFQQKVPKELTSEEITRMGILYVNGEKDITFAHRTFSEFFTAQFFIENVFYKDEYIQDEELDLRIELFTYLLFGTAGKSMLADYMLYFLDSPEASEVQNLDSRLSKMLTQKFTKGITFMLQKGNSEIFEIFLYPFRNDHKYLVDILQVHKSETFYTATFNFGYFRPENSRIFNWLTIKELGRKLLSDDEYKKFLTGKDQKGIILYSLYCYHKYNRRVVHDEYSLDTDLLQHPDSVFVLESILKNLTKPEIDQLFFSKVSPIFTDGKDPIFLKRSFFEVSSKFISKKEYKSLVASAIVGSARLNGLVERNLSVIYDESNKVLKPNDIHYLVSKNNLIHTAIEYRIIKNLWNLFMQRMHQRRKLDSFYYKNPVL